MGSKLKLAAPADDRDKLPAFMLYDAVFMPRLLWLPAGLSRLVMRLLSKLRLPKSEKLPRLCGMLWTFWTEDWFDVVVGNVRRGAVA